MYQINIERGAEKDLRKLSPVYFNAAISAIKSLANNPHPNGSKKLIDSENYWRIRIGTYRILYEILEANKIIRVYKVKHRKDTYR